MATPTQSAQIDIAPHPEGGSPLFSPDVGMVILTWVTFFLLLAVLYKFAWKPILNALDKREEFIRRSIEEADRIKDELAKIYQTRQLIVQEAEREGKDLVAASRKAAVEAAKVIEGRARDEAQILLENAKREIK